MVTWTLHSSSLVSPGASWYPKLYDAVYVTPAQTVTDWVSTAVPTAGPTALEDEDERETRGSVINEL